MTLYSNVSPGFITHFFGQVFTNFFARSIQSSTGRVLDTLRVVS